MQRFTVYRRKLSSCGTFHHKMNPDDAPQVEGVIWTDGTVSLRWMSGGSNSWSNWSSLNDMLNVHGHPEYGTDIVWHDGEAPQEWQERIKQWESKNVS